MKADKQKEEKAQKEKEKVSKEVVEDKVLTKVSEILSKDRFEFDSETSITVESLHAITPFITVSSEEM